MTSALSFHVIFDGISHDLNPLRVALATLQPRVINIVGGARKTEAFSFAIELQKKYKHMRVIFRAYPDDGLHAIDKYKLKWHTDAFGNLIVDDYSGCQRWVDDHQNYLLAGLTVLTDNESVNDNMHVYAAWQAKIMDLCGAKGWRVAVGRFAVGNPRETDYARMGAMWKALAKWHPLHTWSPNEYIPQDIKDAGGMVGRYLLGIEAAKAMNPPAWPFDVSIGEYGVVYRKPDGGLDADAGYSDPRIGWSGSKAFNYLYNQWVKWYKPHGVDVAVYCWGGDGTSKWDRFRVDTDNGFITALTEANNRGELEPMVLPTTPTAPSYQPVNFTPGSKYTLQSEGGARSVLRAAPVVAGGNNVGNNLDDKTEVLLYEVSRVGIDYWYKVEVVADKRQGWLSGRGGALTFTPKIEPPPVVVDPPPVVQPPPYPDIDAAYAREMAMVYSDLADSYEAMIKATRKTSAQWAKLADIVQGKHPELTDVNVEKLDNAA